jgi:esterase/lipase superfamily enzyme
MIYKTYRALTDQLTSEWAEGALNETIKLITKEQQIEAVKLIGNKLTNFLKNQ